MSSPQRQHRLLCSALAEPPRPDALGRPLLALAPRPRPRSRRARLDGAQQRHTAVCGVWPVLCRLCICMYCAPPPSLCLFLYIHTRPCQAIQRFALIGTTSGVTLCAGLPQPFNSSSPPPTTSSRCSTGDILARAMLGLYWMDSSRLSDWLLLLYSREEKKSA